MSNMKTSFVEISVSDDPGEFMVHLDPNGNPIRLYTYEEDVGLWPKDKDYDESDAEWAERKVYDRENYEKENKLNSLFVYAKSKNG
jgi:hypothetical protein